MKKKDRPGSISKGSFWQLSIAILLVGIPVAMILFNGTRALTGITWNFPLAGRLSSHASPEENLKPTTPPQGKRTSAPSFGVYDPEGTFSNDTCFDLEQVYFSWMDIDETLLQRKIESIIKRNRTPVITIEPWNGKHDKKTLMQDITNGIYDENIGKAIRLISGIPGKIYISWGHEMDQDLTTRYPWSGSDPEMFVSAYRYVADKIRKGLGNEIKLVWSPVCKKGCERYWPGSGYADYVGMPVYSYPAWDKSYFGYIRSFSDWFGEKFALVGSFDKPVIIMEMGVTGSSDYQVYWLQEAFNDLKNTSAVEAVLFYYTKDIPDAWGKNVGTPDWRTDPEIIRGFVTWLKKEY